jgi:hypothetical protein
VENLAATVWAVPLFLIRRRHGPTRMQPSHANTDSTNFFDSTECAVSLRVYFVILRETSNTERRTGEMQASGFG